MTQATTSGAAEMSAEVRAVLGKCLARIREGHEHWERHMNRFHPPYRRGVINLTGPWWDCLPATAPYGDGLEYELMDALGITEPEAAR